MTAFIIKSSLSLILLFGLYWFLLRNEKFFVFNRIFLVASVVFSLVVPFISIPVNLQTTPRLEYYIPAYNHITRENIFTGDVVPNAVNSTQSYVQNDTPLISISEVLFILYFSGVLLFLIRFLRNLYLIIQRSRLSEKISFNNFKIVLTNDTTGPCCFFDNIFLNREDYFNGKIDKELLDHEMEHARQSHTIDIILIEFVKILYWFNPVHLLYERAIRINHEYLADNGVIKVNSDIKSYTDKLLSLITCSSNLSLTSGSNNSFTKMRLIMIMKSSSGRFITGARISTTLGMLIFFTLILSFKRANTPTITPMTNHKDAIDTLLIDKDSLKTSRGMINLIRQSFNVIDKEVTFTASGYIKRDTINKIVLLVDNAIVSFGEISIKADSIVLNMITNQLFATGRLNKSGEIIGRPNFKEGFQEIEADELTYNLDTRKGIFKNVNGRVNLVRKDSGSLVSPSTNKQMGNEVLLIPPGSEKPELFSIKKGESTEIKRNFGKKNIHSITSEFLFLNSDQLKPLGIELNEDGLFYKNLNPNWKQDKVRYSCLSFYCSSNNYLTTNHYSETDVIKAKTRNERVLVKMEITRNDFYPILIGNTKGKQSLNNENLSKDLKLFPVAICMSETKLRNRKDTIVIWFKPSEALKKALPENVKIEDYLKLPIRTK